jgi:predicted component of type VI protein secretion system
VINPLLNLFYVQQLLAERGAESAYRQALGSAMSQLRARGLDTSGIAAGATTYLAGQLAGQLGDIRARTAESLARAQLEVFQNLLNLAAQREQAALTAAASGARQAQALLQQASGQLGNIMNAFTALVALPNLFGGAGTTTAPAALPPAPTTPFILNSNIYRV